MERTEKKKLKVTRDKRNVKSANKKPHFVLIVGKTVRLVMSCDGRYGTFITINSACLNSTPIPVFLQINIIKSVVQEGVLIRTWFVTANTQKQPMSSKRDV